VRTLTGGLCALLLSALFPHPTLHAAGTCADLRMQTAVYKGSGSIDEAANFECRTP